MINDKEYKTENFTETEWFLSSPISGFSKSIGKLDIHYLEDRPVMDEGPFMNEERDLINAITQHYYLLTQFLPVSCTLKIIQVS